VTASRFGGQPIYGFTGAEIDRETDLGLIRMGARWHAPRLGRWTSADSLYLDDPKKGIESPLELNLYSYAIGNPVYYTDPTGQCGGPLDGAICGAVVGGLVGGISNLSVQVFEIFKDPAKEFSSRDFLIATAKGAFVGGVIGATKGFGAGALTTAGAGGTAGVGAGSAERYAKGEEVLDPVQMSLDFGANAVGGALAVTSSSATLMKSAVRESVRGVDDATVQMISTLPQNIVRDVADNALNVVTDAAVSVTVSAVQSDLANDSTGVSSECGTNMSCQ
jgi:RHS repeat-associated protein